MSGSSNDYKVCKTCGKNRKKIYFYASKNKFDSDGRLEICKECLKKDIDYNNLNTIKDTLLQINRPFITQLWQSALDEASVKNKDVFGVYMKNIQFGDNKELTWKDGDDVQSKNVAPTPVFNTQLVVDDTSLIEDEKVFDENKNKNDVLRMLGYDPFETEPQSDKRHLYNKLVDFLDEGTLEDSFKLPTVIEIVKSFNQLDKINSALSTLAADAKTLGENVGAVNSLVSTKDKMLKSVLALAKDNGISVNHNNNKSKGAGTLSGIIKQLQEKGFEEADVNIFNIETCEGMQQVANVSNESIFKQLQFDENDYTTMIMEQRSMIDDYEKKTSKLEEENRLLRKQLLLLQDGEA
ncbi:hypothetical protein [Paenibacillus sp. Marseille-Q4541]|uniref:hypothetical protein n=1 Tax=Paenibacillus sp. Marseille-Q4541 TaxID=2831522 RepID=UPI002019D792|nr:hypothetical protein [Paenibacillus sp. Marseille-Q4541]